MQEDELKQARDESRCEAAIQTIKDVMWRFEEMNEGSYTLYDLIGYVMEDLVREGFCAACITEATAAAFESIGASTAEHRTDEGTVH